MRKSIVKPNGTPKNLAPAWQRGQSGNPNGRPKGPTVTTLIRRILEARELCGEPTPGNRTVAECLAEVMVKHAIRGSATHLKMLLDRVEGPVRPRMLESERPENVVIYIPDNGRDRRDEPELTDAELEAWAIERAKWLRDQDPTAGS
jgi:hypothetical protein